MPIKYSIILFTYNPHKGFIKRILQSIAKLKIPKDATVEYIISDNNSYNNWIDEILCEFDGIPFSILEEKKQGKIYSILNAFSKAKGEFLVCLDDDNEIDSNYLMGLQGLIQMRPHVWAWGPGKITVEYETEIPDWLDLYPWLFQEKNQDEVVFDNTKYWNIKYPSGTGLAIKKDVAQLYLENVNHNKMTATCRKGGALTSGGDSQIVYCAIQLDKYAGTAPQLIINHLTEQKKISLAYCKRLVFGVFSCAVYHVEVFEEAKVKLIYRSPYQILKEVTKELANRKFNLNHALFQLKLARLMADAYSWYESHGYQFPWFYKQIVKIFKIQES
ncbi:glycosyltransferase family A protein [Litoribacter populi]|uniref:glycosyltransferase family A protein n=1 Tax=Litoribacter populi TaxID=2598460 RepID=UPI00117C6ED6|nr:glycosyltransferase family A protein [Litoribacter populi]